MWNSFFSDVIGPAEETGGSANLFADDLNVFQEFDRYATVEDVMQKMQECQRKVHKWGKVNRVLFDSGKENLAVLHPIHGDGEPFKFVGCLFDCQILMIQAIEKILSQIRPKIQAILRTRCYYPVKELVGQFKTHVWGLMEYHNGAIFHAADFP